MNTSYVVYRNQPYTDSTGIPVGIRKPCPKCSGVLLPVVGTQNFGADGHAMVDTRCDWHCGIESVHYWTWNDRPPADSPDRRVFNSLSYQTLMATVRMSFGPDPRASAVEWLFAICCILYVFCDVIMPGFTPPPGIRSSLVEDEWLDDELLDKVDSGEIDEDELRVAFYVLSRYVAWIDHASTVLTTDNTMS